MFLHSDPRQTYGDRTSSMLTDSARSICCKDGSLIIVSRDVHHTSLDRGIPIWLQEVEGCFEQVLVRTQEIRNINAQIPVVQFNLHVNLPFAVLSLPEVEPVRGKTMGSYPGCSNSSKSGDTIAYK